MRFLATACSLADAGSAPNGRRGGLLPAAAAALHTMLGPVPAYPSAAAFCFEDQRADTSHMSAGLPTIKLLPKAFYGGMSRALYMSGKAKWSTKTDR